MSHFKFIVLLTHPCPTILVRQADSQYSLCPSLPVARSAPDFSRPGEQSAQSGEQMPESGGQLPARQSFAAARKLFAAVRKSFAAVRKLFATLRQPSARERRAFAAARQEPPTTGRCAFRLYFMSCFYFPGISMKA
jgi:hypothetical protein